MHLDKPHTAPMSLMDSPSNMKLKIKYKATPPSHARPSSSLAIPALYSREEQKEATGEGEGRGLGGNSLTELALLH